MIRTTALSVLSFASICGAILSSAVPSAAEPIHASHSRLRHHGHRHRALSHIGGGAIMLVRPRALTYGFGYADGGWPGNGGLLGTGLFGGSGASAATAPQGQVVPNLAIFGF